MYARRQLQARVRLRRIDLNAASASFDAEPARRTLYGRGDPPRVWHSPTR